MPEAQQLLADLRTAGRSVTDANQRLRLESYTSYWGAFLFDTTGSYPLTEIEAINPELLIEALTIAPDARASHGVIQILHQLPTPPADFTNRDSEIANLRSAVESGKNIIGLQGMGGIGKTTLALKLADQLKVRFPDAQFFIDLKGDSAMPLLPSDALTHVIHSMYPAAVLPTSEGDQVALYRSVLSGRRALLFMDNAASEEQVSSLIPPADCLLIITSRQRLMLPGMYVLELNTLTLKDACRLLLAITPRAGDHAEEIAKLTGSLPLALRLAGRALNFRPDLTVEDYVSRLADEQTRVEMIDASISLSYNLLTKEQQHLWRILAVFSGSFDLVAATYVWELGSQQADLAIGALVASNLIQTGEVLNRYRLHTLARLFAEAQMTSQERTVAEILYTRYYLAVLSQAGDLYLQDESAIEQGGRLIDQEWENIAAGQAWAAAHMGESEEATQLCSLYGSAGAYWLELRLPAAKRIVWLLSALMASQRLNDRAAQTAHLINTGLANASMGNVRKAIEYYEQALHIAREIGDRQVEGAALGNLGLAYTYLSNIHQAIEYHEQALKIEREIGNRRGEGNALANLGNAYYSLGETRMAIEYYTQRLVIAREIGDRRGEGNALANLGDSYYSLGDIDKAIETNRQALTIAREIGDRQGEGNAFINLGNAYYSLSEARKAVEYYEQALIISRELGHRHGEGVNLANLGSVYTNLGDTHKAIEFYEQALTVSREVGDRRSLGNILGNLGNAYANLGEAHKAIKYYEQALVISREIGDRRGEAIVSWNLGNVYTEQGDLTRAVILMQTYVDYEQVINHPDAATHAKQVEELRAKLSSS